MSYSLVWFKRDLRVHDHAPLLDAAKRGSILCLYILEPSLWRQPDYAVQHYQFLRESLRDLALQLRACGASLQLAVGDATEVLGQLFKAAPFEAIFSHEETGNFHTFQRDLEVAKWCQAHGVAWHEYAQHAVVRRLASRDDWDAAWSRHMCEALRPAPAANSLQARNLPWPNPRWPEPSELGIAGFDTPQRQQGGRTIGLQVFDEFLTQRSPWYRGGISSPLTAVSACSRLSPYLALGCISMREAVQATEDSLHILLASDSARDQSHAKSLAAFLSRLHWHCHFIQKLESEPRMEMENLHSDYDGLRENEWNALHFQVLQEGRTGWPMVDACVAMLRETGWTNFRMRAMLVSVATYALWLHWRPVGIWLARQFLDYEPGIHWPQMQMQAGTTGINTTRVYNPIKQAQDHDPQGHFVRRWLPYLRRVPDAYLLRPWLMPMEVQDQIGVWVGREIPMPVVDLEEATRTAKNRVHGLRRLDHVKAAQAAIVEKHGSRVFRDGQKRRRSKQLDTVGKKRKSGAEAALQHSLDFDEVS
ncbi:deoxyribodipyrimidine photo-lyase [Undibacterium cyanobacteriorum]|uniref:Deoxyribodipyrimidine photo-lyase n=1 Tax=Undibacterium cyanobacteriorum TaxID=3073561 RepID=A0ABY9RJA9_9BURK|nr:deoxyribodipyrimidine photo-lyase [Undibacterium sp. 20NA77.5]WMW81318.1 deoxyribodipyrimidine photo-lyase [Undibacterium sp. 20NA77.5]